MLKVAMRSSKSFFSPSRRGLRGWAPFSSVSLKETRSLAGQICSDLERADAEALKVA